MAPTEVLLGVGIGWKVGGDTTSHVGWSWRFVHHPCGCTCVLGELWGWTPMSARPHGEDPPAAPIGTTTLWARVGAPAKASGALTSDPALAGLLGTGRGRGQGGDTRSELADCPPAPHLLIPPAPPGQHPLQQRPPLPSPGRGAGGSCQPLLPPRGLLLPPVSGSPDKAPRWDPSVPFEAGSDMVGGRGRIAEPVTPLEGALWRRTGSVSSGAIQPAWVSFGSTVAHRRRLRFALDAYDSEWGTPKPPHSPGREGPPPLPHPGGTPG